MRVIDCQCFAGGFTLGAVQAGMTLVHKAESTGGFGMPMCEANRHLLGNEWEGQACPPAEWGIPSGGADVVIGNPPCSGFSVMSPQSFRGIDSTINQCMRDLFAYAARIRPSAVIMESVGAAFAIGLPLMRQLAEGLAAETRRRYHVTHVLQNNLSLGGCTRRRRYFLVVSEARLGVEREDLPWIPTVGDALSDLRDLPLAWDDQPYGLPPTWWSLQRRSMSGMTDGHMTPAMSPRTQQRVDDIVSGVDWPPGYAFDDVLRLYYEKHGYLPESWQYQSSARGMEHLTRDKVLIEKDFKVGGYAQTRHWRWDEPGYVMTGHGPGQVWHPAGRNLTQREAARIMGFPDDWMIAPLAGHRDLTQMWGKGVSVDAGRWIAQWVADSLSGYPGEITGEQMPDGDDFVIDASGWWKDAPSPAARHREAETVTL